jgi:CBS domain-containing membrane protein
MRAFIGALRRFAGLGANSSGHLEKWVSGAGGLTGILGVMLISQAYLGLSGSASLVASMGASAVLLFAVPHGPLSQPWAVLGGHLVSAVIGVACAQLDAQPLMNAALAVALAISAMYYLRCLHPPGGATALTAVAGGDAVHALGFHYVVTPVLLNVLVILLVALLFNLPFPWRRYPAAWARNREPSAVPPDGRQHGEVLPQDDPATRARSIAPTLGGSEDIPDIRYRLASCDAEPGSLRPADIRRGGYYCNGEFGAHWQVRQIIDCAGSETTEFGTDDIIAYRVVAGCNRRQAGTTTRAALTRWARYEVRLIENCWQRVSTAPHPAVTVMPSGPATAGERHEQFA